jgi:putative sterol carrier protein
MTDATTQFFEDLRQQGHVQKLEKASGTLGFDIAAGKKTEHWLVTVRKGDVTVSRRGGAADCTIACDRALFSAIASGEANAFAAALRGGLTAKGDARLIVLFRRLFPAPNREQSQRAVLAGSSRR